jgi:hypothetical protein
VGDDNFVTEDLCKERCYNIKATSKAADKNLKEWLQDLDGKFWAVLIITIVSMLSSIGALLLLLLNGGGKS